jgi:hypothetical protein
MVAMIASAPKEVKINVIAGASKPNGEINTRQAPNGAPDGRIW